MSFCTNCGAPNPDGNRFCQNCGSMLPEAINNAVMNAGSTSVGSMPATSSNSVYANPNTCDQLGYNLMVDYMSVRPDVNMDIYFLDWPEKHLLQNNQSKAFMLNPGIHTAVIRIGNRAYKKNITINKRNPVLIHCAWDGRARINIV